MFPADGSFGAIDSRTRDPLWYKDGVIYELRVRSFADGNGDGMGDFIGLREKLPYLQDLGVTTIWLLPFYPSPGRDDGYDISDYTDIDPDVGTLEEFKAFLDEAHRRGLRVITELVLNHTSDQHPWFQRARRALPGSSERDFYVWSDTPDRYADARIIFRDFEASNWAWDPVAKSYFWHRFYSHQPDLNFENPAVQEALFEAVDFWLELGVDGLRLDAVPYLFEEEGTNCENLEPTHEYLRKLRQHVDEKFRDRMLLAEANQWPEDAAAYFGDGDECQMNFHFPIMPRLFMAIHMEDRFPIIDILAQTPQIPDNCQWALFLRNHDELTLEMVTEDERDYMYRAYAHDPTMRINLGIRRRLAPLVGNDRRRMELMNALLMSLPGTPVLYYGDEIGMGDNVYLGDRDGVRTPMQWSSDRNAGFSRANPQRLVLPVIIDPSYHFEAVNVEVQQSQPNSMLWWMKRILAQRKRHLSFGRGSLEFLMPDNARVISFVRCFEDENILVVANLSRFTQWVELDMSRFGGLVPVELFGGSEFPPIDPERPLQLTLGGHGFYWFQLRKPEVTPDEVAASEWIPPMLDFARKSILTASGEEAARLSAVLGRWLPTRAWFGGRGRVLESAHVVETLPVVNGAEPVIFVVLRLEYTAGEGETYLVPLSVAYGDKAAEAKAQDPASVVANLRVHDGAYTEHAVIREAFQDAVSCAELLEVFRTKTRERGGEGGELTVQTTASDEALASGLEPRVLRAELGNLLVAFGEKWLLKVYRRLGDGMSPEAEVGRWLNGRIEHDIVPAMAGELIWRPVHGAPVTLGVLREWVPSECTAWALASEELRRFFDRAVVAEEPPPPIEGTLLERAGRAPPEEVASLVGSMLDWAVLLGRRTADLHLALAQPSDDPAFSPEPYSTLDRRSAYQSMRNLIGTTLRLLRSRLHKLPPEALDNAQALLAAEGRLFQQVEYLLSTRITALRTRHHGDLKLSTVLHTGRDFVITDFDGDRSRPLPERRRKRSPLRDIAGLVGSLHAVATVTFMDENVVRRSDREALGAWREQWLAWTSAMLVGAYLDEAERAGFLSHTREELDQLLQRLRLERALVDLGQRLHENSEQVVIPLDELVTLLGSASPSAPPV